MVAGEVEGRDLELSIKEKILLKVFTCPLTFTGIFFKGNEFRHLRLGINPF